MFLPALKFYLCAQPVGASTHSLDALGQVLVLHGLMSIAWDMQRRDQTSLGVVSTAGPASWKDLLSKAYDRWKADFDSYCLGAALASTEPGDASASEWSAFSAAYRAVYHAAQALLHMDFLDVQIYAGARHILGRPVQQQDYVRSSRVVKRWASNSRERAATAAWHGAGMLRDLMSGDGGSDPTGKPIIESPHLTSLFHVPWCLYLATLSCWAFHHAKSARRGRVEDGSHLHDEDDSDGSDEIVWDSRKEMDDLVAAMAGSMRDVVASQGRRRTNGLVWVVADELSKVRWGIVHAGVVVLRGLVPMRLINQYEVM
ncbi:putative c2h2 finger domain transcription factor [Diaporthe ampelina]|uniref:Putative c2h2 finger domain transcription factor n=1 Tax=Diaporthe ampelina TaxID=1214573 RepID=A0A0G2F4L0_9PEZI|nr:putative c2h2 finger domain transcription factor [Diaporthe ampelina]